MCKYEHRLLNTEDLIMYYAHSCELSTLEELEECTVLMHILTVRADVCRHVVRIESIKIPFSRFMLRCTL